MSLEFEPVGSDKSLPPKLERIEDFVLRTHEQQMRIAIGMCGGTIVSVPNEKGALEPAKNPSQLMQYVPQLSSTADIRLFEVLNKDSTENEPGDWVRMARFVNWAQHYV